MKNKITQIFQKDKVLIVDDIPKWIETAKGNLTYYGCSLENIVAAENTEKAFREYPSQDPTLIITDINFDINNLDDVQGLGLIERLRSDGYHHPIIAMSSLVGDIGKRTRQAGADYFIDKRNFLEDFDNFTKWYTKR